MSAVLNNILPMPIQDPGPNEIHSISFHPTVWKWLKALACKEYGGNVSAAVAGFVLCHQGNLRAKAMVGECYSYRAMADVVARRCTIDDAIREVVSTEPDYNAETWIANQIKKTQALKRA